MTTYDDNVSPGFVHPFRHNNSIYNSSIATSASASTASVWSDTSSHSSQSSDLSSQTSDDGFTSGTSSDGESCDSYCGASKTKPSARALTLQQHAQQLPAAAPAELRKNPRRTAAGANGRPCPPTLFRQEERKNSFVDNLVGRSPHYSPSSQPSLDPLSRLSRLSLLSPHSPLLSSSPILITSLPLCADSSTQIVEAIWPTSSTVCRNEAGRRDVLPLRMFIQETLRRSRTSYSTLQVALYYLVLIKPRIPSQTFVTEQVDDRLSTQALQCGRRMFLAALILASKYLQDRNYSARAWSKISGLATHEINQNEMAFLYAVNWKLHICDDVFRRWTDIVLKHTPPSMPPSGGAGLASASSLLVAQQQESWRHIILGLDTDLTNIEELIASSKSAAATVTAPQMMPRRCSFASTKTWPQSLVQQQQQEVSSPSPMVMEPSLASTPVPPLSYTPARWAPSMGLLPTPRLTPQVTGSGLCTPAVGASAVPTPVTATAIPFRRGSASSMSMAMSQATSVTATHFLDRPPTSASSTSSCLMSSPQSYCPARRSSLANSISTASSPESMVSDTSRSSRSSSISSASSMSCGLLASAPAHPASSLKMSGAPPRFRAGLRTSGSSERLTTCSRPTVPSVPEDQSVFDSSSPLDSYTGPVGKPKGYGYWASSYDGQAVAGRKRQVDDMVATDAASDAARTLQELHSFGGASGYVDATSAPLQDNVRDLLRGAKSSWPNTLVRSRAFVSESNLQQQQPRKRVCCAAEVASASAAAQQSQPGLGLRGGMWQSILN